MYMKSTKPYLPLIRARLEHKGKNVAFHATTLQKKIITLWL